MLVLLCIFWYFYKELESHCSDKDNNDARNVGKVEFLELKSSEENSSNKTTNNKINKINYNIHVFYYAWYANPDVDGEFRHWNYKFIPLWEQNDQIASPADLHYPPIDIGSNYYPTFGCYSSSDSEIIELHAKLIRDAGIGVLAISWKPPSFSDSPYNLLQTYFDIAEKYKLKITIHIEHYKDRNIINLREHLRIFLNRFGDHPALYKIPRSRKNLSRKLPLIYIYDSYLIPEASWESILGNCGQTSIRGTKYDAIFIGLLADVQHRNHIKNSHFDGFYTYFGANGFTYGSTWGNWQGLADFANQNKLIFIPSVSPGYIDSRVRPWNTENVEQRHFGQYYNISWKYAIETKSKFISITSFNDWHDGTQIEPASPKAQTNFDSLHYEPDGPYFYMSLTKEWISRFSMHSN
ncbi:hypothetical protein Trydic_g8991 [Trypoxylus dichotomus]